MAKFCTGCGAAVDDGLRFCTECGAPLGETEAAPARTQSGGNQASYAPRQSSAYGAQQNSPYGNAQPSPYGSSDGPVYGPGLAYGPGASNPARQQNASPPEAPRSPARKAPGPNSPYAPMTTWGFVGTMLLLSIPLVGLVLACIWAFGGCRKINKRNLARAFLILMAISLVLGLIMGLIVRSVTNKALEAMGIDPKEFREEGGGLGALAAIAALDDAAGTGGSSDDLAALSELADMMEGMENLTGEESGGDSLNELIDDVEEINREASAKNDGWPATLRPYPGGKAEAVETYRTEITDTSEEEMKAWIEDLKKDGFHFEDFYDFGFTEEEMLDMMNGWWATDGNIYLSVSYYDGVVTVDHTKELPDLEGLLG